jgi:DNA repair exonuclease SbcCD ATPase subunit
MRRVFLIALTVALSSLGGCGRKQSSPAAATTQPSQNKQWTSDEIAKDPQGYLVWSDAQIQNQIQQRNDRLKMLSERQSAIAARQKELKDNLDAVENVRNRLEQAYQRAQDEDRWPVQMAGRKFERAKAQQILDDTAKYLQDRKPLADDYDQAIQKMTDTGRRLQDDIDSLKRLHEQLALNLEQIRMRQGMEELDQLRKTESELAEFSKMLGSNDSMVDLASLKDPPPAQTVDVDSLLK